MCSSPITHLFHRDLSDATLVSTPSLSSGEAHSNREAREAQYIGNTVLRPLLCSLPYHLAVPALGTWPRERTCPFPDDLAVPNMRAQSHWLLYLLALDSSFFCLFVLVLGPLISPAGSHSRLSHLLRVPKSSSYNPSPRASALPSICCLFTIDSSVAVCVITEPAGALSTPPLVESPSLIRSS